ncbi:hypothetical protein LUZ60_006002 [Juncus effusus]|nr:hypothetical protein LUZ60_006002 [Juncus effusus]
MLKNLLFGLLLDLIASCLSLLEGRELSKSNMASCYEEEKMRAMERKVKLGEITLRCAAFAFGVIAVCLIGSDSEVQKFFSIDKKARFTNMKALVFLLIANGLAAGHSLVQGIRCFTDISNGTRLRYKIESWAIFSCDQVITYVTLSALGAAAETAVLVEYGQPELQWMKTCNFFKKFCFQSAEGAAMAFLVFLSSALVSCISAFNLFRLYDNSS